MNYNLFEKTRLDYYIKLPIYLIGVFSLINVGLIVGSFFKFEVIFFLMLSILITLICTAVAVFARRTYGKKLCVQNDCLKVFDINNKLLFSIARKEVRILIKEVVYSGMGFGVSHLKSIILCNGNSIYEELDACETVEYRSYWKNNDAVFIQNPELISIIEKMIENES